MVLKANDEPSLYVSALIVEPRPPVHLCAGIVSLAGVHPGNPAIRIHLQLQAAGEVGDDALAAARAGK